MCLEVRIGPGRAWGALMSAFSGAESFDIAVDGRLAESPWAARGVMWAACGKKDVFTLSLPQGTFEEAGLLQLELSGLST